MGKHASGNQPVRSNVETDKSGKKKMIKEFHGIIPPVVTPLTTEQQLDIPGLERLLEHMISGGVHGLFILGTTGEGPALGCSLQKEMIRETMRIVKKRLPILTGISSPAFADSVELANFSRSCGCNGVVAAPPCYFNLGDAELTDYYRVLAGEVRQSLFIYNMPGMTKSYLKPALIRQLAEIDGIRGYKDSSGNMADFHDIILTLGNREDFSIFVGPEELLGESVLMGADGGVAGGANLNPALFVGMYNAALQGDLLQMRILQKNIYAQRRLYSLGKFQSSMIKGLKSALRQREICEDHLIAPFNHFETDCAVQVAAILKELF